MILKINNNIIENILDNINLVELISSKLTLIKKGDYFVAICPFHKESIPSFSINEKKKFYYCFGCKVYGNAINFLMNFEKLNFSQSILILSKISGINIENNIKFKFKHKNLYYYTKLITKMYIDNLYKNINYNYIKNYFIEKKWTLNTLKKFYIGYSSNNLIKKFKNNKNLFKILNKLNFFYKYNNFMIDRFNNRIIFPIFNENNNIIAFGGRSIKLNKIKYINSSESVIFKKKYNLYGLNFVKKIYKNKIPKLIIVEGYTDVISLYNNNINNSVSLLGSNISYEQISLIFKYTNTLIFCFDGDKIGLYSSIRAFKKILSYITDDRQIKFIILPFNEDPDSIIRKIGKKKFNILIDKSIDISNFLFKFILKIKITNIYNKIYLINKFIKIIKFIPSDIIKFLLIKRMCLKINIELYEFYLIYNKKINFIYNFKNKLEIYDPIYIATSILINYPFFYKFINIPFKIKIIYNKKINFFLNIFYICNKYNLYRSDILLKKLNFNKNADYLIKLNYINTKINLNNKKNIFLNILNKIYFLILHDNKKCLILKK